MGRASAVNACFCNDCQAAMQRLESLPDAAPVVDADGGSEFMLFRRDRVACAARTASSRCGNRFDQTRRMIATCCGTPM
jgi:hypothetical protein